MSKLYEEAIADAQHLRELAAKTAERRIIEAMTPKIKMIVEQELTGDVEYATDIDDLLGAAEDYAGEMQDPTIDIDVAGDANITVTQGDGQGVEYEGYESVTDEDDEEVILSQEAARALANIIHGQDQLKGFAGRLVVIREKIERFDILMYNLGKSEYGRTIRAPARNFYTQLRKEVISLRDGVLLTERAEVQSGVRSSLENLIKEFQKMSRRHSNKLFGLLSEAELDELDVVFDEEDLESLGVEDVEDVEVADLETAAMLGGGEVEEEEVDVEEEPIDLGELDLVLDTADLEVLGIEEPGDADVSGLDATVSLAGEEEVDVDVEEDVVEEVYEIDEGALRRELRRMRRLREQDEAVDADPAVNHGGEVIGDVILDVNEDDLINALADELGRVDDVATATVTVAEQRRRRARRMRNGKNKSKRRGVNEGRRSRALQHQLKKYKTAVVALRNQLVEMNLFNAKLLYVNKLMQSKGLSTKQQRAIVEALDNARTLREAKLLYKSLTESLKKRGTLSEGRAARTLGSSSRSTRSASPAKSGVEVDRWSVLAGLSDKTD